MAEGEGDAPSVASAFAAAGAADAAGPPLRAAAPEAACVPLAPAAMPEAEALGSRSWASAAPVIAIAAGGSGMPEPARP